jgi:hypothetical protein
MKIPGWCSPSLRPGTSMKQHDAARHDNDGDERVHKAEFDIAEFSHLRGR